MVTPRTMPGVLELLPAEQVVFNRMLATIRRVYERFGFLPIETPAIELTDILLTKTGGETERQMYFVQSTGSLEQGGDPEMALNFDLTVPLARYVAEHQHELVFPFRRYQIQRVYRGESPQRGRWREFYQCDIDVVDRDSLDIMYDAEMPAVINSVFDELGIGEFTIRLNNRKLMRGLMASCGVDDPEAQASVLREIDKLEKRGAEWVGDSLTSLGIAANAAQAILAKVSVGAMARGEALEWLASLPADDGLLGQGVEEARSVLAALPRLGVPDERFRLDPAIARGLDYYTGTVYETSLDGHPEVGSICSGGRYDDLAGLYTSTRLPGVGISIGITRLFGQLREIGLLKPDTSVTAVVTLMDDAGLDYTLDIASMLRSAGINTAALLTPGKLGKQLKHADRIGARYALIAGSDERAAGTVTIKDLVRQTQAELALSDAARHILAND